ncbi:MAG: Gfo/Idh/MocA family oxidoreductase [Clostridia bacterium]
MYKIKLAVIGAGGIARNMHLPSISQIDDFDLVAICDLIEEKAVAMAEKYSIPNVYTNYIEMIEKEDLDAIYILTEPDQIFRIARTALLSNLHVFVEKPAGITSFQTKTLAKISKEQGKILQVGMNRRYIPLVQEVIKKMKAVTEITQVEGTFVKNDSAYFYGGCADSYICDAIHTIDLMSYVINSQVVSAATAVQKIDSDIDNCWHSVMKFENNVVGILKSNYKAGGRVHSFEFHGPGASAFVDLGFAGKSCSAKILYSKGKSFSISSVGAGAFENEELDGKKIANSDDYYNYYGYFYESVGFAKCIKTGEKPLSDISDAVKSMQLAEFLLENKI